MKVILLSLACGAVAVGAVSQRTADPALPDLLAAAGTYIAEYEKAFESVVSEERYEQTANARAAGSGLRRRVMKSDVLTFNAGPLGWMAFRDVLEVDGVPVGDQPERLLKLVADPSRDAVEDAKRVTEESARYNIGSMTRTINVPTTALVFLRRENQARSAFELGGMKTVAGRQVAVLAFRETADDRMIRTIDNAAAAGRFWIEPASGRVVQTELTLASRMYAGKVVVEYADQPKIGLWVPVRMTEQYTVLEERTTVLSSGATHTSPAVPAVVDGRAEYRNFRKFETKAGLIIK